MLGILIHFVMLNQFFKQKNTITLHVNDRFAQIVLLNFQKDR